MRCPTIGRRPESAVPAETVDRLAATGFLRTVPDPTDSNERGLIAERMNVLADEVEVLTSSVMGITVGCARCHNHKYDPIPQRDYYRLSAILQGAYDPYEWKGPRKRELDLATKTERDAVAAKNEPLEAEIKRIQQQIREAAEPFRKQALDEAIAALPAEVRDDVRAAATVPADKRSDAQRALAEKYKDAFDLSDQELSRKYADFRTATQALQKDLATARGKLTPPPRVRVLADNLEPSQSYLLQRGDPVGFGDPVEPGVPGVLQNAALKPYAPAPPFAGTSGRRLALANWLTQPNHPLTARVMVNQMWLRHFGRGIVPSVSNFGHSGVPPTHPGTAGLARHGIRRARLEHESHPSPDAHLPGLPPNLARGRSPDRRRSRQRAALAHAAPAHGRRDALRFPDVRCRAAGLHPLRTAFRSGRPAR